MLCLQQITRPSQEDKSDDKNEEDKSEKSEKKEDEEKKDEEEKDEKEDSRWVVTSCLSWCHSGPVGEALFYFVSVSGPYTVIILGKVCSLSVLHYILVLSVYYCHHYMQLDFF